MVLPKRTLHRIVIEFSLGLLVFWLAQSAVAQDAAPQAQIGSEAARPKSSAEDSLSRTDLIKAAQKDVASAMQAAEKALAEDSKASGSDKAVVLRQLVATLKQFDSIYERQLSAQQEIEALSIEERKYQEAAKTLETSDTPVSVSELDTVASELETQKARLPSLRTAVNQASTQVEQARQDLAEKREALPVENSDEESVLRDVNSDSVRAQMARWELKRAEETLRLRELVLEREKRKLAVAEAAVELLNRRLTLMADRVTFSREEFDDRLQQIEKEELELKRELKKWMLSRSPTKAGCATPDSGSRTHR